MDIKQEVMQLRSQNNSLEFQVQTKDELIASLRAEMMKALADAKSAGQVDFETKLKGSYEKINDLQLRVESLQAANQELKEKCSRLTQ